MYTLRRRAPYQISDNDERNTDTDNQILDEQEQEELIEGLRKDNETINRKYSAALKVVVGLSCILQLAAFKHNPLLTAYPSHGADLSIPVPAFFTILAICIHLNLIVMFFSNEIRVRSQLSFDLPIGPLSYQLLYLLSAVAPTLCLFLQKPWQTTVWWCTTPVIVFIVQTVMDAIQESSQGIADLETKKYTAPGA